MTDEPTCGLGLAEQSLLPARLATLTACVAENLEVHMSALDVRDDNARRELEVYRKLVDQHREIAARLRATAQDMAGARDLPDGRHDEAAMLAPGVSAAFERLVQAERELLTLLQARATENQAMLAEMRAAGGNG